MTKRVVTTLFLIAGLVSLFVTQESRIDKQPKTLSKTIPVVMHKIIIGYLKHAAAEFEFIRTSVFTGDLTSSTQNNAANIAYNYKVITTLYPQFLDPYYFSQAALASISPDFALKANEILLHGYKYNPDVIIFPFFASFNYFYHMNNNRAAADLLLELSKKENAPPWFGHLAATLSAKDGDLQGGLFALRVMAETADEAEKVRYIQDIVYFKNALKISTATKVFKRKYGHLPSELNELIPEFINSLPDTGQEFELKWNGEAVTLERTKKTR